ncbi:hypothetical protein OESDEN_07128 [Oesophagostomum dentatum]|uniref:Piezo TM1-24 domain-containing protein n=1 Tax=Oesophagostomum dentatum TaxID=61180 RepID=A0A0B1TC86_OESDE|nr:hypothetical protein OESDEN_07128 [Oesophagostomum dentatum]
MFLRNGQNKDEAISDTKCQRSIRLYSWLCLLYCLLTTIALSAYQIYEAVGGRTEQDYMKHCNDSNLQWLRYTGLLRFHGGDGFESAKSILPEIVAFIASLISCIVVAVVPHRRENLDVVGPVRPVRMDENGGGIKGSGARSIVVALKRFSNFAIIVSSAIVGCVQPSLLNGVYFLSFLFVASWWALYKPLRHAVYNRIKKFLLFFAALHILVVYIYQIPIIQQLIPVNSIVARIVGLSPILLTDCNSWYTFWLNLNLPLPAMINPVAVLIFYHALMVQLLWTYNGSRSYIDENDAGSSVHEEFLLLVQYVCSMNITPQELLLPDWLKMVGFVIAVDMWAAFVTLTVKWHHAQHGAFVLFRNNCIDNFT